MPSANKKFFFPAISILAAIYIPLFGCIHPIIRYNFKTVSYVLIITIGLLYLHRVYIRRIKCLNKNSTFFKAFNPFIILNLCLILLGVLHVCNGESTLSMYLGGLQGIFLSLVIILYLSTFNNNENLLIFERIAFFVVIAFIAQFFLSFYESFTGRIIAQGYDWLNEATGYYNPLITSKRLILNIIGIDIANALSLNMPFSGLLGQHNYWGTQLPFYNLIFWTSYFSGRRNIYFLLLLFVLLASVFNTSRFGIAAILVTDIFLLAKFVVNKKYFLKIGCLLLLILTITSYWDILSIRAVGYFESTDTLSGRVVNYLFFISNLLDREIIEIILGSGPLGTNRFMVRTLGIPTSFESEFLGTLITYGFIGFGFLIYFFAIILIYSFRLPMINKELSLMLFFCMIMVSAISNLLFDYASYAFVTIMYAYIIIPPSKVQRALL